MPPLNTPWSSLDALPGLSAVPAVWRARLGELFPAFNLTFLESKPRRVTSFPCPRQCGCSHRVVSHPDGSIAALCRCDPARCDRLDLCLEDITPLELSHTKLGRSLSKAFGLERKEADSGLPGTRQIGAWAGTIAVFFTVQHNERAFRSVIAQLAVRRRHQPFILLAPTSTYLDAPCQELLAHAGAGFFALDSHVILTAEGSLLPRRPPGEIFSRFTPEPHEPVSENTFKQAVAVLRALDTAKPLKKAPLYVVFKLYCADRLSTNEIFKRCDCSKATIINRLAMIRKALHTDPKQFRAYSSAHFDRIDDSLSDSRAEHIHRKTAANIESPEEDESD